jgi:TonB family protein
LESVRDEIEESLNEQTIVDRTRKIISTVIAFSTTRHVVAGITVVVLSLLGFAVATDKRAINENGEPSSSPIAAAASLTPVVVAQPIPVPASTVPASTENSAAKSSKPRVTEQRSTASKKGSEKPDQPTRLTIPSLSSAILSGLDSAATKAAAAGNRAGEAFNVQPPLGAVSQKRATFADDQSSAPQRARLIGELPTPAVPAQVVDVEGEVRVRFNVDPLGRPMIETFSVVSSPNPLLTAAVRKVIPAMRFEPAKTGGAEPKAIGDVVQIGFQFARSR